MSDEGLKEIKNSQNSTLHTLEKRTARHLTNMMLWNGGDAHLYIVFSTFSSGELNWRRGRTAAECLFKWYKITGNKESLWKRSDFTGVFLSFWPQEEVKGEVMKTNWKTIFIKTTTPFPSISSIDCHQVRTI